MGVSESPSHVFVKKEAVNILGVDEPSEEHHIRILCRKNPTTQKWICSNVSDEFFYLIANLYTKTKVKFVNEDFMSDPRVQDPNGNFQCDITLLRESAHHIDRGALNAVFPCINTAPLNAYIESIDEKTRQRDLLALYQSARSKTDMTALVWTMNTMIIFSMLLMMILGLIQVGMCYWNSTIFPLSLPYGTCEGVIGNMKTVNFFTACVVISAISICLHVFLCVKNAGFRHITCNRHRSSGLACSFQSKETPNHYLLCAYIEPPPLSSQS